MTAPLLPGAEPWSHAGGPAGALVLHGFTGNPGSLRGIATALADAGFTVELPLLPGHGTAVEDMLDTTYRDWLGTAEDALEGLLQRCERVVVVGLSMGGALTAWLASDHPELAGIACINAVVTEPDGMREAVQQMIDAGMEVMDGIGSDIADPDNVENAYPQTPLRPLASLFEAAAELEGRLGRITCPVLVVTSTQDHVVDPSNSDVLADSVAGPVERVRCERSYHVVTMDYDRDLVEQSVVAFAGKVTAS